MCSKLLHLNVRHLQVSISKSVTNVNCGSQKSGILFGGFMASTVHRRQAPQNALVALDATAETGNLQRTLQAFEMLPVLGQTQVRAYNIGQLVAFSEDHVISNFN